MTVLHDAYFRRSSEGYSLACPGESARPRVFVSFRADLAFAVSCLVSCAPLPRNDVSFLSGSVADPSVSTLVPGRVDERSVAPGADCVTWVWAPRSYVRHAPLG